MSYVKYCPQCGFVNGVTFSKPENCDYCNHLMVETKYTTEDYLSVDRLAMVETVEKEYINNNPEFSEEAKQERLNKINQNKRHDMIYGSTLKQTTNKVKCPYCQSEDVDKISTAGRAVSVGVFGLASKKIGKQWHCNKCKSDF